MPAILCVAAHPDDEAFGPAGTIAKYVAAGVPVDLLTLTRGQRGTQLPNADTPEALGLLRTYETRASAAVLGIRNATILDYVDGDLDKVDTDELAGHIFRAIDQGAIDAVIGLGPLGLTRHADHIASHHAMLRAAERSPREPRVFYIAVEGDWAKQMNIDGPEAQPTHDIDITGSFEKKLTALACHSSQEDSRQLFGMLAENRQTVEWFHRARPPYTDARRATDLFA
jgi:N-acetylglucosamine malate deacetylase 2